MSPDIVNALESLKSSNLDAETGLVSADWAAVSEKLGKEEWMNIKNHPQCAIRFRAYKEILNSEWIDSKAPFIIKHLADEEECWIKWHTRGKNQATWVRIEMMDWLAKEVLTASERAEVHEFILDNPSLSRYFKNLMQTVDPIPEYYDRIKSIAQSGNFFAYIPLIKYKNPQDAEICIAAFRKALFTQPSSQDAVEFRKEFVKQSLMTKFPNGVLEVMLNFHRDKMIGDIISTIAQDQLVYSNIVKSKSSTRAKVLNELLEFEAQKTQKEIAHKIWYNYGFEKYFDADLLALAILLWEKYDYFNIEIFNLMTEAYPDKIAELLHIKMNRWKIEEPAADRYKSYIKFWETQNESTELFINIGLRSNNVSVNYDALELLKENPWPSSKPLLFQLLLRNSNFNAVLHTIKVIGRYELTEEDKFNLEEWYRNAGKAIDEKRAYLMGGLRNTSIRERLEELSAL